MLKFLHSIIFISLFISIPEYKLHSQNIYDFDLPDAWEWEDLINKTIAIDPPSAPLVQQLRNEIAIHDARLLLRELSKLESLEMLKDIYKFALDDNEENRSVWFEILRDSLNHLYFENDFTGLLKSAIKLAALRSGSNIQVSNFKKRNYLPQPVDAGFSGVNLKFNYSIAETIAKFYSKNNIPADEINFIAGSKLFADIYNPVENDLTEKNVMQYLERAITDSPLHFLYKWVNPASYLHYGGVSVYPDYYIQSVDEIKSNEENIKYFLLQKLSQFFPGLNNFNVDIIFIFGNNSSATISRKENIFISLEYFTDDYEFLVEKIMHVLFKLIHSEVQLPVYEIIFNSNDLKFAEVLNETYKNGTANYAGPFGSQTRPSSLLEKDFVLFNSMFEAIYEDENSPKADTMIRHGFSGIAPFNTMGTQMAYIIENILGKKALADALNYGPFFFFTKYIEAYTSAPDRIRSVFRFNSKLQSKIKEFNNRISVNLLSSSLKLKNIKNDLPQLKKEIDKIFLANKIETERLLLNAIAGQLYLEADDAVEAFNYYYKVAVQNPAHGSTSNKIAGEFINHGFYKEAIETLNISKESSPEKSILLASAYFNLNDRKNAINELEKALIVNYNFTKAKNFLARIKTE